jgi:hypothetical protein
MHCTHKLRGVVRQHTCKARAHTHSQALSRSAHTHSRNRSLAGSQRVSALSHSLVSPSQTLEVAGAEVPDAPDPANPPAEAFTRKRQVKNRSQIAAQTSERLLISTACKPSVRVVCVPNAKLWAATVGSRSRGCCVSEACFARRIFLQDPASIERSFQGVSEDRSILFEQKT